MLLLFLYYTLYIITSKKIAVKEKRKHKITKKVEFLNYLILVKKNSKEKKSSKSGGTSSKSTSRVRFNINDSTYVDDAPYDIDSNVQLNQES